MACVACVRFFVIPHIRFSFMFHRWKVQFHVECDLKRVYPRTDN
jgi:hypothetical protein